GMELYAFFHRKDEEIRSQHCVVEKVLELTESEYAASINHRCDAFIRKLDNGYDTIVGSAGSHLSGGERQRIAIARAMLKNAPVVILDEATAYIDPENEALVQKAISALTVGKTLIVIAHRLSTI